MTIKVAVVGLGKMGLSHLAIANALPQFEVIAICDTAPLIGSTLSRQTGIPHVGSYDAVLDLPGLQAVIVATPTSTHAAMARAALMRGLHVFCEKPLTLAAADSLALDRLAGDGALVAQAGYHNRFIGTFREVRRLLDLEALGRLSHVHAEAQGAVVLRPGKASWRGKVEDGGGCLYDYAAHPLNLMNWYAGAAEACSGAVLKRVFSPEVEDEVYATLGFAGGATGQLSVNWSDASVRKMSTRITLWGEGGKIQADRQEVQVFLTGRAPIPEGYREGWTVRYITDLTPPVAYYLRGEEYSAQLEAFGDACLGLTAQRENSFADAALTDMGVEMIRAAAASGGVAGRFAQAPSGERRRLGRVFGR